MTAPEPTSALLLELSLSTAGNSLEPALPLFPLLFCAPGSRGSCCGCWAEAAVAPDPPQSTGMALGRAIPAPCADGLILNTVWTPLCPQTCNISARAACPGMFGVWVWGICPQIGQRIAVNGCWRRLSKAMSQSMKILGFFLYPQALCF